MLERLRQFEGADQVALYEAPHPTLFSRLVSILRELLAR